jgi:RNA polymerase sigma factor for flagellar operon FliA
MTTMTEISIWQQLKNETNEDNKLKIKNKLIEKYYPLVCKIARVMSEKIGRKLSEEELASFGVDGLYIAIRKFDEDRGVKFESYASPRIKGSMLDEIRKLDIIPRSVRMNNHAFELQRGRIESEKGYRVSDIEVANAMGIEEDKYCRNIKNYQPTSYSSFDGLSGDDNEEDFKQDFNINLIDRKTAIPDASIKRKEFFNKLVGKNFSVTERQVVYMYYYENFTFDIIADKLNLSESRISQIHANLLPKLKDKVLRNPNYFANITSFLSSCSSSDLL